MTATVVGGINCKALKVKLIQGMMFYGGMVSVLINGSITVSTKFKAFHTYTRVTINSRKHNKVGFKFEHIGNDSGRT